MQGVSAVYDIPASPSLQCSVTGRLVLSKAVIELHRYRFRGPQGGVFHSSRNFLDLALSPRPGTPRAGYVDFPDRAARPLGALIFVPAGKQLQSNWGEGEQVSICCGFNDVLLADDSGEGRIAPGDLEACLDVRSVYVRESLVRLAREIETPGFCSEILAEAIWVETMIELARYLRQARITPPNGTTGRLTRAQVRQIEECIQQPGRLPAVTDLAKLCGLSTRHFFRMFRATTGMTLSEYTSEERINRAKRLLSAPRPAVKEIAWQCGFETAAAFSAAFRKAVGMTPKEFRRALIH